jgi:OOP family OmpA-OmpF porin
MNTIKHIGTLTLLACAMLAGSAASAAAGDAWPNQDWADTAWYAGAGVGQSRAAIDEQRLIRSLTGNATLRSDERDTGYKVFVGKNLNRYFALEGTYGDLGKFGFNASTPPNGVLNGEAAFRGVSADLLGHLPLTERFSAYGRLGVHYTEAKDRFTGNRLLAVTNPQPRERKAGAKFGLGLEYRFTEALSMRGEVERYRVKDAVGNRGDVDLYALNLVYRFGKPAAKAPAVVVPPAPAPEPVVAAPLPPPPPPAPPAPVAVAEKVSFAAHALFDFDKAVLKPDGKSALDALLGKLQGMTTEVMITVGHTDSIGSAAYNQALSLRRAEAVKRYLVASGIAESRVYTEGKGETQPAADNATAGGRAENRRVTVEVVGTRTVMK